MKVTTEKLGISFLFLERATAFPKRN
jgi:hypothetical protein